MSCLHTDIPTPSFCGLIPTSFGIFKSVFILFTVSQLLPGIIQGGTHLLLFEAYTYSPSILEKVVISSFHYVDHRDIKYRKENDMCSYGT